MAYRGILFDFDGVIAKTMEDNFAAWKAVLAEYDYELHPEEYFASEGEKLQDLAARYGREAGIDPSVALEIVKKKDEYYLAHHVFGFYPGVPEFLALLVKRDIPRGLVTAGTLPRLMGSVPEGFLQQFTICITNETSGRGKPFPDPYLQGAQSLKLQPSECIVIENAPIGIRSAKSAGAYCIGICSTLPREQLSAADEIVENFEAIKKSPNIQQLIQWKNLP